MHARVTRTIASVGSTSCASGTFSIRTSPAPYITVALMAVTEAQAGRRAPDLDVDVVVRAGVEPRDPLLVERIDDAVLSRTCLFDVGALEQSLQSARRRALLEVEPSQGARLVDGAAACDE